MSDKLENPDMTPPTPGEVVLPLPREVSPAGWVLRGVVWAALLATLVALIFWLDVPIMRWRLRHWPPSRQTFGWFSQTMYGFRDFGQFLPIVVIMLIIWRMDRRRYFIIAAILLAQFLASVGYNSSKLLLSRYRPYAVRVDNDLSVTETADTWLGQNPPPQDQYSRFNEDYRSFPSGHSSAAFAFAGVLAWFYPRLRVIVWPLAAGCAFSRFYDVMHWPGDCLAGGMIGYTAAYFALRPYAWVLPVIWYRRWQRRKGKAGKG